MFLRLNHLAMNQNSQKNYWNKLAPTKEFTTNLDFNLLNPLSKDAKIVDYGCGYGRTLNQLYKAGYHNLTGFDFSEAMIQRGKNEFPHLKLKIIEENHTKCDSDSVDMVILFALLTCVVEDKAQQKMMREIHRILKPGGRVYINDFLLNDDERNRLRYNRFEKQYGTYGIFELPDGGLLRHYDENYLKQLMEGFTQEYFKKTVFTTMNGHQSNGFVMVAKKEG